MKVQSIRFIVLAWIVMSLMVVSTAAQSQAEPDSTDKTEKGPESTSADPEIPQPYDEITVTATRTPTLIRELGRTVNIITAEEIIAQGARTVDQVLETVPGFSIAKNGSFGGQTSVYVRGGEADFNLLMIDGVPVTLAGGEFDFGHLTTANIERIEVIRGPASVLYGSDAAGSVINMITRKGKTGFNGNAAFEAGSYGTILGRANLSGASEKMNYSFGFLSSDTDGIHETNSRFRRTELSGRGGFAVSEKSLLEASIRFTDYRLQVPTDFTGNPIDPNNYQKGEKQVYSARYGSQLTSSLMTQVQYGYHRHDTTFFTLSDGIVDFFDSEFQVKEDRHLVDWQNSLNLGSANLVTAGLTYRREAVRDGGMNRRSVGFYVQDQINLGSRVFVAAGIRYDNNDRFRNYTSGNADLAVLANDSVKLRASVGNGFRSPSFGEIIGSPDFGITGNPDLKPEMNMAFDTGIDIVIPSGDTQVSGTFFYNRYSDLIEFTFFAPPGSPNYQNIEEAESKGIELQASQSITRMLRVGGNYTYTSTEVLESGDVPGGAFEEGKRLLRRPPHMAGIFAMLYQNRYRMRIDFKYKGLRDDFQFFPDFSSGRVSLPAYWKVDFGITVPLARFSNEKGALAVVFRGENLFNKDYQDLAGYLSPGRLLMGGLELMY